MIMRGDSKKEDTRNSYCGVIFVAAAAAMAR